MAANNFEEKSNKTYDSAEVLISNNHKNSSVHCYYYSCFQLLNHFLNVKCKLSEKEIHNLAQDKESHNKIIGLVKTKLDEKHINPGKIFGDLHQIKKERLKADYGIAFVINTEEIKNKTLSFRKQFKSLIHEF